MLDFHQRTGSVISVEGRSQFDAVCRCVTVGGFWPKSYAAGNRMSSRDWLTSLFSAEIAGPFLLFITPSFFRSSYRWILSCLAWDRWKPHEFCLRNEIVSDFRHYYTFLAKNAACFSQNRIKNVHETISYRCWCTSTVYFQHNETRKHFSVMTLKQAGTLCCHKVAPNLLSSRAPDNLDGDIANFVAIFLKK